MSVINLEDIDRDGTFLKDGPFDGQLVDRPSARMRRQNHPMAFRLPDKQQPWRPEMGGQGRVRFALYLWYVPEQAYCWMINADVSSDGTLGPIQLDEVLNKVMEMSR